MYDYIKGIFTFKSESSKGFFMTVEASGIGYMIETTSRDFTSAGSTGVEIKIYTVLVHKEDKVSLCGFLHKEDRDIFNILTSVSGVGSKMALTLLDEFEPPELIGCVIEGSYKTLTRAKGVGPKLAQKIILELKDKLVSYNSSEPLVIENLKHRDPRAMEDAQAVLISLGYERNEIKAALSKASDYLKENASAEEVLKRSLQILSYEVL